MTHALSQDMDIVARLRRFDTWLDRDAADEIERLRMLVADLLTALEFAGDVIGHPDDTGSKFIEATIAKARSRT